MPNLNTPKKTMPSNTELNEEIHILLTRLENSVDADSRRRLMGGRGSVSPKVIHLEAFNKIKQLIIKAKIKELENLPVGSFDSTPYRDRRLTELKKQLGDTK